MSRQHQMYGFMLTFFRERNMYSHLIAVKIGIVSGTDARMDPNRRPLDQHGIKSLDTQFMERRSTIEQHRVVTGNFIENIKASRGPALQNIFSVFYVGSNPTDDKFP